MASASAARAATAVIAKVHALARSGVPLDRTIHFAPRCIGKNLALVDPDLHTDAAERRECFNVCVVNVGAQRMQRHFAVVIAFGARNFRAAQTT